MEEKLKLFLCEDDENLGMLLREYLQAKDLKQIFSRRRSRFQRIHENKVRFVHC